jgi:hypothetical protein
MEDPTTDGLDTVAGVCKPVAASCPADYVCCSDDPATTLGRLPNYFNGQIDGTYGVPIFSGANNALSYSGQCVDVGGFPSPFATGCPVPCNPTWAPAQVAEFCGPEATCCPFRALDPIKDCVLDSNTNLWRAVRGSDIPMLTTWGDKHTTNQDPQGDVVHAVCQRRRRAGRRRCAGRLLCAAERRRPAGLLQRNLPLLRGSVRPEEPRLGAALRLRPGQHAGVLLRSAHCSAQGVLPGL